MSYSAANPLIVSVPSKTFRERLGPVPDSVRLVTWDLRDGPAPVPRIDLAIPAYADPRAGLDRLAAADVRWVQSQSIGYDGVGALLPEGIVYCNAASVHEASTAELAVTLVLASLRGLPEFVDAQRKRHWEYLQYRGLADSRVLILGYGAIGRAVEDRLAGFEVEIVRAARTARDTPRGPVHAIEEVPALLADIDVVIVIVPLSESTRGMIDTAFLAAMKPGSLLVNVARGPVVDTDALVAATASGHIRAALDVVDPEPLPVNHPLWTTPGVLIVPHVGGGTGAMMPRMAALVQAQIGRILAGETPVNIVLGG